jgi:hypothetical protein
MRTLVKSLNLKTEGFLTFDYLKNETIENI